MTFSASIAEESIKGHIQTHERLLQGLTVRLFEPCCFFLAFERDQIVERLAFGHALPTLFPRATRHARA